MQPRRIITADIEVTDCDCDIFAREDLSHDPGCEERLVPVRATFVPRELVTEA